VALLWVWLLQPDFGLINNLLWSIFHIRGPQWLYDEHWVLPALILKSLWGVGGPMLIYLASLQGIPTQLYEAAEIDGANAWRRFWSVTLPMLVWRGCALMQGLPMCVPMRGLPTFVPMLVWLVYAPMLDWHAYAPMRVSARARCMHLPCRRTAM